MQSILRTVKKFWRAFDQADFEDARKLMKPQAVVYWPNTREVFRGRDNFIVVNQRYPGRWRIKLVKAAVSGKEVITVVKVSSPKGRAGHCAVSFFQFNKGLISEITEYWGDTGEPPKWRIKGGWSQRY